MSTRWTTQREISNRLFLNFIVKAALWLGRPAGRAVLCVTVCYYLVTARDAVKASRDYLSRVLDRKPRLRDVFSHFFHFANVSLDRVYFFSGRIDWLDVRHHNLEVLTRYQRSGRGVLLLAAHLGSFEGLRTVGRERGGLPLIILMDRAVSARANAVLETIHPRAREAILDTSKSDVDRVLKVNAALEQGKMVGLMADRYRKGDRTARCRFLGAPAAFPLSPWLLAGLLKAPVILAFGLYWGENRYELYFESFSEGLTLPRRNRNILAQDYAQRYADRLASYTRLAPFNWFNFYDFWGPDDAGD